MATTKVVDMLTAGSSALAFNDYFYKTTSVSDEKMQASTLRDYMLSGVTPGEGLSKTTVNAGGASANPVATLDFAVSDVTAATVTAASGDLLVIQDVGSADVTKKVTAQSIADLNSTPGDVIGPLSSDDNAIARYDGTSGTDIQNSLVLIDDAGNITAGTWSANKIAVLKGGTGADNASDARTNLGLDIGSDVQAWDPELDQIAGLTCTTGAIVVGDATPDWDVLTMGATGSVLRTTDGINPTWGKVDLTSNIQGNLPVTHLNSGSGAGIGTFFRGDGVWASPAGGGNVTGPVGGATDNAVARYDSTTGTLLQDSANFLISDAGAVTAGSWTGTAIANAYIGSGIDAAKLADGSVSDTEFKYINSLTSNAQTQIDGKQDTITTLAVDKGGTGQTSYTNGQLLIGNSTGNTLTKATLTEGTNITITEGAGTIEIAAAAGGDPAGTAVAMAIALGG